MQNTSSNVVLVGLNDKISEDIGLALTNEIDMFYLNVKDLIEYNLLDKVMMREKCGPEYLKKQEEKILSTLSEFENTVVVASYDYFANNADCFGNIYKIFLKLTRRDIEYYIIKQNSKEIDDIVYKERTKLLERICNKTIILHGNIVDNCKTVLDVLKEKKIYEN